MNQGVAQVRCWCAAGLVCMATTLAGADPMRPLTAPAGAASAADVALPAQDNTTTAVDPRVRRLLAIREENTGKRAALFGDRWLRAGDRYTSPDGETLVLAIGANHVELEQNKVRSTHHLLAPLLPPQWPTLPARPAAGKPGSTASGSQHTPPPAPSAAPPVATAPRTERPSNP